MNLNALRKNMLIVLFFMKNIKYVNRFVFHEKHCIYLFVKLFILDLIQSGTS